MHDNLSNDMKGKRGFKRILNAAGYSRDGLLAAWKHEAAFRQLVILHSILITIIFYIDLTTNTKILLITISFISLITELFNSAIEAVVDYISLGKHPLAKRAKDIGSAAQMLALILLVVIWAIILI